MAIRVAGEVATDGARKNGKTFYVASPPAPVAVYVFAYDHPDASKPNINIMYEMMLTGACVRRKPVRL